MPSSGAIVRHDTAHLLCYIHTMTLDHLELLLIKMLSFYVILANQMLHLWRPFEIRVSQYFQLTPGIYHLSVWFDSKRYFHTTRSSVCGGLPTKLYCLSCNCNPCLLLDYFETGRGKHLYSWYFPLFLFFVFCFLFSESICRAASMAFALLIQAWAVVGLCSRSVHGIVLGIVIRYILL